MTPETYGIVKHSNKILWNHVNASFSHRNMIIFPSLIYTRNSTLNIQKFSKMRHIKLYDFLSSLTHNSFSKLTFDFAKDNIIFQSNSLY